jgi:hypothetical protein
MFGIELEPQGKVKMVKLTTEFCMGATRQTNPESITKLNLWGCNLDDISCVKVRQPSQPFPPWPSVFPHWQGPIFALLHSGTMGVVSFRFRGGTPCAAADDQPSSPLGFLASSHVVPLPSTKRSGSHRP